MDILEALQNVPPPPCVGCRHVERCAERQAACAAFWMYAEHARVPAGLKRNPSKEWMRAVDEGLTRRTGMVLRKRMSAMRSQANPQSVQRYNKIDMALSLIRQHEGGLMSSAIGALIRQHVELSKDYEYRLIRDLYSQGRIKTACGNPPKKARGFGEIRWVAV